VLRASVEALCTDPKSKLLFANSKLLPTHVSNKTSLQQHHNPNSLHPSSLHRTAHPVQYHSSHRFTKLSRFAHSAWYVYSSYSISQIVSHANPRVAYTDRNSNSISSSHQSPYTPRSPSSRWPLKSHRCPTAATRPSTVSTSNKPTTPTPRKTTTRHPPPPPTPPLPLLLSLRSPRMRLDGTLSSNTTPL
jgi:hypothetical protein